MGKPKLTKRAVESARPPERKEGEPEAAYRRRWAWKGDGSLPGFGVKVYPGGRRVFALRYRSRAGRSRMLTLGVFGELAVEEARNLARAELVKIRAGEDPRAEREKRATAVGTVGQLVDLWLEEYAKVHRKSWKADRTRIKNRIKPALGKLDLADLTTRVLSRWHRKLGETGPVEANRALSVLRGAWIWAEGEELLPEELPDPFRKVKRFKESDRDRWLTKEEIGRLTEALQGEDVHTRAIVRLLLLSGLRPGELLGAKWEDVDLGRGELRLPATKIGKAQTRVLTPPAVQILRALPRIEGSPYLFPSPRDPEKPRQGLKRAWKRLRKVADLEDTTLHDLRRSCASHLVQSGVPLATIQEILGQSSPSVVRVYARLSDENQRKALEALADHLGPSLGLSQKPKEAAPLPDLIRDLLETVGDDSEALAARLQELLPGGRRVEA